MPNNSNNADPAQTAQAQAQVQAQPAPINAEHNQMLIGNLTAKIRELEEELSKANQLNFSSQPSHQQYQLQQQAAFIAELCLQMEKQKHQNDYLLSLITGQQQLFQQQAAILKEQGERINWQDVLLLEQKDQIEHLQDELEETEDELKQAEIRNVDFIILKPLVQNSLFNKREKIKKHPEQEEKPDTLNTPYMDDSKSRISIN